MTALYAVEVAAILSQLHPLDRWTYIEKHRPEWDDCAEMPATGFLVVLAERIPGARIDEESRVPSEGPVRSVPRPDGGAPLPDDQERGQDQSAAREVVGVWGPR